MDGQATVKYGLGLVGANSQPRPAGSSRAGTITCISGRAEVRAATVTALRVLAVGNVEQADRIEVTIDHVETYRGAADADLVAGLQLVSGLAVEGDVDLVAFVHHRLHPHDRRGRDHDRAVGQHVRSDRRQDRKSTRLNSSH